MKVQLLTDIAEAIRDYSNDIPTLYEQLVGIFVRNGMTIDQLEECIGIDEDLDAAIDEYEEYHNTTDDDFDDDWPDGGREDF
ncbi:hypothetical protein UFOVP395_146 [uncultured Caudovirales phage]|jgi:hypothetical protein|uniref:Uncharacterized protein n=1 Tax=uncultured Caudovirales phage TaxID=2100421 RepID=A0A6J5M3Q0_9CAUD|nr:hypothetical protein UFOVP395_146 [uncultured Caudovirales phage]